MKNIKDFIIKESTEKPNALYYGKTGMNDAPSTEGTEIFVDPKGEFLEIWFNKNEKSISVKSMEDIEEYKKYPNDEEYDYDALINGVSKLKFGESFKTYDDVIYVKIK